MNAEDQQLIEQESQADPEFGALVQATLARPGGAQQLAMSAQKAVVNEFNPTMYPETVGMWTQLRAAIRETISSFSTEMKLPGAAKSAFTKGLGNLGQDIGSIIGPIVSAVAGAASAIYIANLQATTAKQIQTENLDAQMAEIRAKQAAAAAQQAEANAQMAQTGATGQIATATAAATAPVAAAVSNLVDAVSQPVGSSGIPIWAVILGAFAFAKMA